MKNIWFVTDTHFGDKNLLSFLDASGKLIRGADFASMEEHDERIIEEWNSVVKPWDKIYHLGDVGEDVERTVLALGRLHGRKRLLLGNHDDNTLTAILPYFEKVGLWRIFRDEGFVASHMPLTDQFREKTPVNVHGHTHQNILPTMYHVNICPEIVGYRPLHMDELRELIKSNYHERINPRYET